MPPPSLLRFSARRSRRRRRRPWRARAERVTAVLLRAAARAMRSSALRSILARHGPFSTKSTELLPIIVTLCPVPEANDDDDNRGAGVAYGEEDGDLWSHIFRRLAKWSTTAAFDKWAGEGHATPMLELRCIACDLRHASRYKHALEAVS